MQAISLQDYLKNYRRDWATHLRISPENILPR